MMRSKQRTLNNYTNYSYYLTKMQQSLTLKRAIDTIFRQIFRFIPANR